jgi:type III polyketide synthase
LTVQACKKALKEWGGDYKDLTHTIAVTCTDATTPGYDLLVAQKLGLSSDIKRMLLAGIGCAGGMTTMRVAAEIACGATARNCPARILCFACELCTLNARCNLDETARTDPANVSVAGALFSDGASAFVLCNDLGLDDPDDAVYQLLDWGNTTIPQTAEYMGFSPLANGSCGRNKSGH